MQSLTRMLALAAIVALVLGFTSAPAAAQTAGKKPNILVIMGDDIGLWNISAYHRGIIGYSTPNIDRLAREGGQFMTYYAQQSCTAGRSAFITGQLPFRTGLSKVGLPGADLGIRKEDPTIAELPQAARLHDRPVRQEPSRRQGRIPADQPRLRRILRQSLPPQRRGGAGKPRLPEASRVQEKVRPRGVIRSTTDGKIEDTGPLTKKRMETIDEEVLAKTQDFLSRAKAANKPFFVWFNTTRMHNFTHVKEANLGKTGHGFYADGMVEHDALVGTLLDFVDQQGLADNTIVVYTTDNGPMVCLWPDAGITPYRGEKNTNWEGGWAVPALIRWPGVVKPGTVYTDLYAGEDWLPTSWRPRATRTSRSNCSRATRLAMRPSRCISTGTTRRSTSPDKARAREEFFYFSDDGDLLAIRYQHLKVHFMIQEATGFDVWRRPFTTLRAPVAFDLAVDPLERGQEGIGYEDWLYRHAFIAVPVQEIVGKTLATFREFPPRQKPASFTIDQALEALTPKSGRRRAIRGDVPPLRSREAAVRQDVEAAGHREDRGAVREEAAMHYFRTSIPVCVLLATVSLAAGAQAQTPLPPSPSWRRAMPPGPDARVKITEAYAAHVARDVYFWAWPLVNMYNRRLAFAQMTEMRYVGPLPQAPLNRLTMLTDYIAPEQRNTACPNQDVVYGIGLLALDVSPVVIQVPDFGALVYQIVDLRTDSFAQLGKMYGTTPGFYLLAGPHWQGEVPKGIAQVFRASTNSGLAGPRVFMTTTRVRTGRPSSRCCGRS